MTSVAIDTNVPVVANARDGAPSLACTGAAVGFLEALIEPGAPLILLDSSSFILGEYMANLNLAGQPGLGDAFMKWVHYNQANPDVCTQVPVTPLDAMGTSFAEFPADPSLRGFDRSDRKFVAVVLACGSATAEVVHATDRVWWKYEEALRCLGVSVRHLCSAPSRSRT